MNSILEKLPSLQVNPSETEVLQGRANRRTEAARTKPFPSHSEVPQEMCGSMRGLLGSGCGYD